jgi:hypothetical protein
MFCIRGVFSWSAITALYPKNTHTTKINIVQFNLTFPLKEAKDFGFAIFTPSRHKCQKPSSRAR